MPSEQAIRSGPFISCAHTLEFESCSDCFCMVVISTSMSVSSRGGSDFSTSPFMRRNMYGFSWRCRSLTSEADPCDWRLDRRGGKGRKRGRAG